MLQTADSHCHIDMPAFDADRSAVLAERDVALASEGGSFAVEFRIRRAADGAERWLAAAGRVMRDAAGRPARMLGVNRDVTEAHAREAELRAMLEANPIGVLRGDVRGRIMDANDALLRLVGRSRAELEEVYRRLDGLPTQEAPTVAHRPRRDLFQWPLAVGLLASFVPPVARELSRGAKARAEKRRAAA